MEVFLSTVQISKQNPLENNQILNLFMVLLRDFLSKGTGLPDSCLKTANKLFKILLIKNNRGPDAQLIDKDNQLQFH